MSQPNYAAPSYGPGQYRVAAVVLGLTALFVVGLVVWQLVKSSVRALLWPREEKRRAGLSRTLASVEVCDRLNEAGACDLIVAFQATASYREARQVRLRALQFFPGDTIEQLGIDKSIPLLVDASDVRKSAVDFDALFGPASGSIARSQYVRGTAPWRVL